MKFEVLYKELILSTEMIHALLAGITENESRVKPTPEAWSILELLGHLHDEEREDFREHLDFILNRPNDEWHSINPSEWVTERKYNEQDFRVMQNRFFAQRRKSLKWLNGFTKANWDANYNSKWGSRSAGEMLASWVAHDNLAIRQFVELRRFRIEQITKPYAIEYAGDW